MAENPLSQEHPDATVRDVLERGMVRRRLLEKLAGEAQSEIEARQAKSMVFAEDGEIVPVGSTGECERLLKQV